jgi:uncharacterized protein DUF6714
MDIADALATIRAAFPEQPLPEMTLRQAQLGDQTMSREITDDEWRNEGERDRGIVWTQLEETMLRECDAALSFLDEDGFVYYLPAFLTAALRQIAAGKSDLDDLVTGAVSHVTNTKNNYALARLKRLSDAQIDAVVGFLHVVQAHGGFDDERAGDALRSYWETPESRRRTLIYVP